MPDTPEAALRRMICGYWVSQAIYVATKLRLPDLLADGPKSAAELAEETDAHPQALARLLRMLSGEGVFHEDAAGKFRLTSVSEPLRASAPLSMMPVALMMGDEHYRAWGELLHSVMTGGTGFEKVYGKPVFEYLAEHPDAARTFDAAMTGIHGRESTAMLDAYDFTGVRQLVDVGGGNGTLLRSVVERYAPLRGVLFDLPHVIERAKAAGATSIAAGRMEYVSGSFFESVPAGADAYLMRHIIHDWYDDRSLAILGNIRQAIAPDGRLLVVESVIEPGNAPSFAKLLDLNMLVLPGGMERTAEEYRQLFAAAGFELTRIVPTRADVSVIEGRPTNR